MQNNHATSSARERAISAIQVPRKVWIDWMKVIAMLFVIWGHCFPKGLEPFIYAFNVPVFFMISGYLTKEDIHLHPGKIWSTLVLPYLIFCTLKDLGFIAKHITDGLGLASFGCILTGLHSYDYGDITIAGCKTLWYVYTLFILKVIACGISGRRRTMLLLVVIMSLAAAFIYNNFLYTDSLSCAWINTFVSAPFYFLGWIVRNMPAADKRICNLKVSTSSLCVVSLVSVALISLLSDINGSAWMYKGSYGEYMSLFLVCAVVGGGWILAVSKYLEAHVKTPRALGYISIGTLPILCFHRDVIHPVLKVINDSGLDGWIRNILSLGASLLTLIAFVPAIYLLQKYLSFMLGKTYCDKK